MHKLIVTYCCALLVFLAFYHAGVRSGSIADCRRFKTCNVTPGTGRCDIALSWEKCNGSNATSFSACVEEGCIDNCICNCLEGAGGLLRGAPFLGRILVRGWWKGRPMNVAAVPSAPPDRKNGV